MGDGVNIASRIEGVADPGGIVISRAVHEQVRDRIDVGFEDRGEVTLKNIRRPVHVFALTGSKAAPATPRHTALSDKSPSALPSGKLEQEYFARLELTFILLRGYTILDREAIVFGHRLGHKDYDAL